MAYQTTSIYREKVYNEDARHKLKILFNGVEYPNIDNVCEKLTINSRIIPNGNTSFALDNFISKEATLILHNVALEDIVDPVEIQIGTLTGSDSLGDIYEYVPIGIFNIQDIPTTDKDKTTITLRDNAIKFDFPYNAEPLIEGNGGSATKMQIFQDICTQAGVGTNVSHFLKDDELFGGYDNSISGRQYIAYLAEQAGAIPVINRYGNLDFVYLNNLEEQELPLQFVESYQNGDPLEISRVLYEDAKRKFEKPTEEESNKDTLYINSANPYITNQQQIEDIYDIVDGFKINSFKTGKILGNPAIDPYDIITLVDGNNTYKTLATNTLTYNGKLIQTFDTQVKIGDKQSNVSLMGEPAFQKYAKTNIDNINNNITTIVVEQNEATQKISTLTQTVDNFNNEITKIEGITTEISEINQSVSELKLNFQKIGGSNIFKNSVCYFYTNGQADEWSGLTNSYTDTEIKNNTISGNCFLLQSGALEQIVQVPNGNYTISFNYKKLIPLANVLVSINETIVNLTEDSWKTETLTFEVNSNTIDIKFISDTDNSCYLSDLIGNLGTLAQVWSNNPNEAVNGGVKIGKGIEITSNTSNIKQKMDNDGNRIINTNTGETVSEFTDKGIDTQEIKADKGQVANILILDMGTQTWFSRM